MRMRSGSIPTTPGPSIRTTSGSCSQNPVSQKSSASIVLRYPPTRVSSSCPATTKCPNGSTPISNASTHCCSDRRTTPSSRRGDRAVTQSAGIGIHQVMVAASPGDAITNLALGTRRLLRRVGRSEIYAHHIAPEFAGDVLPISAYGTRRPSSNVLLFHASIGQPSVHAFLTAGSEPLVLVYHNITPGRYFERYDPAFAELLDLGRREIAHLMPRVVCAIADSQFNASELA